MSWINLKMMADIYVQNTWCATFELLAETEGLKIDVTSTEERTLHYHSYVEDSTQEVS